MKKQARILVVDDDLVATEALKHALEKAGMAATVVHEGQEALNALRASKFDLVLLDIKLPLSEIDGWEVLMRMKSDEALSRIPVCVLSNAGLQHEVARGQDLGADAYWLKAHISIQDVIKSIGKMLDRRKTPA